jgi:GDPmannose 4,6-dehydratase
VKIKTAFITGVSGQDGSLLAEFLLSKGYCVYGLMRESSLKDNLKDIIDNKNFQIVYGDLLNNDLIRLLLETNQFDEIYNLASQSNIRLSYDNPILTFNTTLIGTLILLDNIKKYSPKSKVFQASSSAMFGNNIDDDGYQRETTPFSPISPYASSKLFSHNICCNYRDNYNLFISNGILYNHESTKSKTLLGVLNVIVKNAIDIKNKKINEYYIPNLKVNIDYGYAEDYIKAIWLILQQENCSDYIISSGVTYNLEQVCDYVFNKLDLDWKKHIKTDLNAKELLKLTGDNSKLKSIGWKPKYDFHQLLDNLINHYNRLDSGQLK